MKNIICVESVGGSLAHSDVSLLAGSFSVQFDGPTLSKNSILTSYFLLMFQSINSLMMH